MWKYAGWLSLPGACPSSSAPPHRLVGGSHSFLGGRPLKISEIQWQKSPCWLVVFCNLSSGSLRMSPAYLCPIEEENLHSNAHTALSRGCLQWQHPTKTAYANIHYSRMIQFLLALEGNLSKGTTSQCLLSAAQALEGPRGPYPPCGSSSLERPVFGWKCESAKTL